MSRTYLARYISWNSFLSPLGPNPILAFAFLDERYLLLLGLHGDNEVRVIDVEQGREVDSLPIGLDREAFYSDLSVSPNGALLALDWFWSTQTGPHSYETESMIQVWNLGSKTLLTSLNLGSDSPENMAFSPDGAWFGVSSSETGLTVFETSNFEPVINHNPGSRSDFSFVPGSTEIYLVQDQGIFTLDILTGHHQSFFDPEAQPSAVTFDMAGNLIAVGDQNGKVYFLEPGNPTAFPKKVSSSPILDLSFQPSGQILAVSTSTRLYFLALRDKLPTLTPRPPTATVAPTVTPTTGPTATAQPTPTARPTGTAVPLAEAVKGELPVISAQNATGLQHVASFTLDQDIEDVSWANDGSTFWITDRWGQRDFFRLDLDEALLKHVLALHSTGLGGSAVSPDGARLAVQNAQGRFDVFDLANGTLLQTVGGDVDQIYADIAWSPQMDVLATMFIIPLGQHSWPEIRVYDLESGKRIERHGSAGVVDTYGLLFSPGASFIATSSRLDGNTYVWNRSTSTVALSLWGTQPAFNPSGSLIAVGALDSVYVYSTADGSRITTVEVPQADQRDTVRSTFSADSSLLVTTGSALRLWQLPAGDLLTHLESESPYTHAVFSPDGKLLVTVRGEGAATRIIIWAVVP